MTSSPIIQVSNILKTEAAQTNFYLHKPAQTKHKTIETILATFCVGGGGKLHGTVGMQCFLIPFFLLYPLSDFIIILKHDRPVI